MLARSFKQPKGLLVDSTPLLEAMASLVGRSPVIVADNIAEYVNTRNAAIVLEGYPSLAPPWDSCFIEYPSSSGRTRRGVWAFDATFTLDEPFQPGTMNEIAVNAMNDALGAGAVREDVRWVLMLVLVIEQEGKVWGPAGMMGFALDEHGQVIGNRWSLAPLEQMGDGLKDSMARSKRELEIEDELSEWMIEPPERALDDPERMLADEHAEWDEQLTVRKVPKTDEEKERVRVLLNEHKEILDSRLRALREYRALALATAEVTGIPDQLAVPAWLTKDSKQPDNADPSWLVRALAPAMQTIAFLHCKNVETEEHAPPAKVQKKRQRNGKLPLVRYRRVKLNLPRKTSSGKGKGGGITPGLHIVAGHFAHYGACCGNHPPKGRLFGKHEGVYWVPTHVRGDEDEGYVVTDFDAVV